MKYSSIKKNEIVAFTAKLMKPKAIVLNELDQTQKDKKCFFLFHTWKL